ncbi:alkane oxidation protein activator PraA [Pseudomonas sp. W17]|uniref:Alkane oxidation protein activator PraA n=1 Tax=Pseudomonas sp. W17 TaxID=3144407 RepID=A0AAU7WPG5_9PSED
MSISPLFTAQLFVVLVGISLMGAVEAARIEPANTEFTAKGPISFAKSIINADCTIQVSGKVSPDGSFASVEKVDFSGGLKCGQVEATHLPWKLIAKDETSGAMSGIQVTVHAPLVGGDCGPSTAEGSWNNSTGKLEAAQVSLDGGCTIKTVSIQMPPTFRVAP